ncbi:MAG: methyl-accepting chemotaxis protein, partial [bacterium]|nr:methyl-accepting chemotaxis protein [bacterium]
MRFKIAHKMGLLAMVVTAGLLSVSLLSLSFVRHLKASYGEDTAAFQRLHLKHRMQFAAAQVQQFFTDASVTGMKEPLKEAQDWAEEFRAAAAEIEGVMDDSAKTELGPLLSTFETFYNDGRAMVHAYLEDGREAENVVMADFAQDALEIAAVIDSIYQRSSVPSDPGLRTIQGRAERFKQWIIALTGAVILLCLGAAVFASRVVLKPMQQISQMVRAIANGDFVTDVAPLCSGDEFQDLYEDASRIKRELGMIIEHVTVNSSDVASASEELQATSTQIVAGMKEQNRRETDIAAALNELRGSIDEVAGNSRTLLHAIDDMVKSSESGNQKSSESREKIDQVCAILSEASTMGGKLSRKTQEVGNITRVIDEIVEQTHLLAFNAAIEAAHAGEHGRGFAVVADEVRKLSEKTSKATQEIDTMVQEIQEVSGNTVVVLCEAMELADEGARKGAESSDAFNKVTDGVAKAKQMIEKVEALVREGSSASSQISDNANEIAVL